MNLMAFELKDHSSGSRMNAYTLEDSQNLISNWLVEERKCTRAIALKISKQVLENYAQTQSLKNFSRKSKIWDAIVKLADLELQNQKALAKKNFGLTEEDFGAMMKQVKIGDDQFFEQVFLNHFESCMSFLKRQYSCSHEDAYDATMDTLLVFSKRLKEGKVSYGNLRFLFTRMAGQIYLKMKKREQKEQDIVSVSLEYEPDVVDEEKFKILEKAWNALCESCSGILKAFYYEKESLNDIAVRMEKTAVALRKQKQRCVEKLRTHFIQFSKP